MSTIDTENLPRYKKRAIRLREYRLKKKAMKYFEKAQSKVQPSNQVRLKLKKKGLPVEVNRY